jgi:uncharacterized protein
MPVEELSMNQQLYFTQRCRDAGFEKPLSSLYLCVSAALREYVLVAAEGRAALFAAFVV